MNTVGTNLRGFLRGSTGLLLAFLLSSCGAPKCQAPATQSFKTLAETQWRLVATNDKSVTGLDKYNFLIYNFARNFSGNIQQVRYNDLFETPYKSFTWNINKEAGQLTLRYQDAPPAEGAPATQRQGPTDVLYGYELNREFRINDQRGNFYRFVPFTGVVDPDLTCDF
jgi:hypothetical protein